LNLLARAPVVVACTPQSLSDLLKGDNRAIPTKFPFANGVDYWIPVFFVPASHPVRSCRFLFLFYGLSFSLDKKSHVIFEAAKRMSGPFKSIWDLLDFFSNFYYPVLVNTSPPFWQSRV